MDFSRNINLDWIVKIPMLSTVRIRKLFPYFVAFVFCNIILVMFSLHWNPKSSCDFYGSQGVILNTCADYKAGLVGGSLCEALCEKAVLQYTGCVNHKLGRSVLYMNYTFPDGKSHTVVMKIQLYPDDAGIPVLDIKDHHIYYSSDKYFVDTMKKNVSVSLKKIFNNKYTTINVKLLSKLWGYNITRYLNQFQNKSAAVRAAFRSIWLLAQQKEYVLMRLNQHIKSIPRIYGTCGAAFFMEYAGAIGALKTGFYEGRGASIHLTDWKPRAAYALQILEMLPDMDTKMSQPFHLCDVKDPNIGIRADNSISLIDLDHGSMETELSKRLRNQNCTDDLQCGFLTCPGMCDTKRGNCNGERTNNNLQSVCEVVFLDKLRWINTGLLRAPPKAIEKDLMRILYQCAYPPSYISPIAHDHGVIKNFLRGYKRRVVHKPGDDVRQQLMDVIKRGLAL